MFLHWLPLPQSNDPFNYSSPGQAIHFEIFNVDSMRSSLFPDPVLLSLSGGVCGRGHTDLGDGRSEPVIARLYRSVGTSTTLCSVIGWGRSKGFTSREGSRTKHCRRRLRRGEHAFSIYRDQPPGLPEFGILIIHIHLRCKAIGDEALE